MLYYFATRLTRTARLTQLSRNHWYLPLDSYESDAITHPQRNPNREISDTSGKSGAVILGAVFLPLVGKNDPSTGHETGHTGIDKLITSIFGS